MEVSHPQWIWSIGFTLNTKLVYQLLLWPRENSKSDVNELQRLFLTIEYKWTGVHLTLLWL
jgi:hypothetical protein